MADFSPDIQEVKDRTRQVFAPRQRSILGGALETAGNIVTALAEDKEDRNKMLAEQQENALLQGMVKKAERAFFKIEQGAPRNRVLAELAAEQASFNADHPTLAAAASRITSTIHGGNPAALMREGVSDPIAEAEAAQVGRGYRYLQEEKQVEFPPNVDKDWILRTERMHRTMDRLNEEKEKLLLSPAENAAALNENRVELTTALGSIIRSEVGTAHDTVLEILPLLPEDQQEAFLLETKQKIKARRVQLMNELVNPVADSFVNTEDRNVFLSAMNNRFDSYEQTFENLTTKQWEEQALIYKNMQTRLGISALEAAPELMRIKEVLGNVPDAYNAVVSNMIRHMDSITKDIDEDKIVSFVQGIDPTAKTEELRMAILNLEGKAHLKSIPDQKLARDTFIGSVKLAEQTLRTLPKSPEEVRAGTRVILSMLNNGDMLETPTDKMVVGKLIAHNDMRRWFNSIKGNPDTAMEADFIADGARTLSSDALKLGIENVRGRLSDLGLPDPVFDAQTGRLQLAPDTATVAQEQGEGTFGVVGKLSLVANRNEIRKINEEITALNDAMENIVFFKDYEDGFKDLSGKQVKQIVAQRGLFLEAINPEYLQPIEASAAPIRTVTTLQGVRRAATGQFEASAERIDEMGDALLREIRNDTGPDRREVKMKRALGRILKGLEGKDTSKQAQEQPQSLRDAALATPVGETFTFNGDTYLRSSEGGIRKALQ